MSNVSSPRVNVAVVGLGFMGVTHLRAYLENPQARVAAVCDAARCDACCALRAGFAMRTHASDAARTRDEGCMARV